ncbi:M24 family metallopeptidase [Pseudochrobactrum sp. MP213Fo]|uniref:M24 family metallopeptidase n=1 Tax=Pseudochrobactrum sp. MP213Fo TaxID=3022250 RepID=UPI003B9EB4D1
MSGMRFKSYADALNDFNDVVSSVVPISLEELHGRIAKLQSLLKERSIKALYIDTSSSLVYFTGLTLGASERMHGALIPASGAVIYISPAFEEPKIKTMIRVQGEIATWEEHEDSAALVIDIVSRLDASGTILAIDPLTPFIFADNFSKVAAGTLQIVNGQALIVACRQVKSDNEIALIQMAMSASLAVHKSVYQGLYEGITTTEVCEFINKAHSKMGFKPLFAAAQFGEATAYPHGVPYPQTLKKGDMVLIDMGAILHGYRSDITRTYVFGTPTARQQDLWLLEKQAQIAAFNAAQIGETCENVDLAARQLLADAGYGPEYEIPGLPHRTGHGLGLDIHEEPYIVKGNLTKLEVGMCFSIEPMLCLYGECGIRLEDIAYMTAEGPRWFTEPAASLDEPFV